MNLKLAYQNIFIVLFVVFILSLLFILFFSAKADSSFYPLKGWLWSSNIGWISLNCQDENTGLDVCSQSNYQVLINRLTGNLSGYAFSNNVGWIDFNPSGPYPEAPNRSVYLDLTNGKFYGWAKAINANAWIKISGQTLTNQTYGVKISTENKLTGFAWGSIPLGWIGFFNAYIDAPIIKEFYADPSEIKLPQTSTLYWQTENAEQCEIIFDEETINVCQNQIDCQSGSLKVRPTKTTTYTLFCKSLNNLVSKSAQTQVKVLSPLEFQIRETRPRQ